MPDDSRRQDAGQSMLSRLSSEMVRLQKQYWGKGPTQAKSYFLDDMLLIVMFGGLTGAEKTMVEFGDHDLVRSVRQTFQNRMTERLTGMVAEITGRRVLTYQSQIVFDPDRIVELFVLEGRAEPASFEAAAEELIDGDDDSASADDDNLNAPSSSGQAQQDGAPADGG